MSSLEFVREVDLLWVRKQRSKSALEYSFFCCEEVNEEEDKEDDKEQNANERNGKEGRKNSTPLSFSSEQQRVCVRTRFCFSQREHTKTDREEIFISEKRDEHGRRRGGKVEDPDCLLLCDDSDDKNDEFCEEEKQRRFRRRRTRRRFVATTRTSSTTTNNPRVLDRSVQFNERAFGKRLEHEERDALPLELRFGDVGVTGDSSGRDIDNAEEGVFGGVERAQVSVATVLSKPATCSRRC